MDPLVKLSKGVSVVCVLISMVLKVPQIVAIAKAGGKTQGVSLNSLRLEMYCLTVLFTYHCGKGYPINTYLEYFLIIVQDWILLFLILRDQKRLNLSIVAILGVYMAVCWTIASGQAPTWCMDLIITSVSPGAAVSRCLQIYSIVKAGDSGQVSALTWGLASTSVTGRVFTTLVETADNKVLTVMSVAWFLNVSVFLTVLFYRKPAASSTKKTQ